MCPARNGRRQRKVEGDGMEGGGRVEGWVAGPARVRFINRERERETHQERKKEIAIVGRGVEKFYLVLFMQIRLQLPIEKGLLARAGQSLR